MKDLNLSYQKIGKKLINFMCPHDLIEEYEVIIKDSDCLLTKDDEQCAKCWIKFFEDMEE